MPAFCVIIQNMERKRFDFDEFDERILQALENNAEQMGKLATRGLVAVPDSILNHRFQTPTVTELPRRNPDIPDQPA